jgi:hypothetical protein
LPDCHRPLASILSLMTGSDTNNRRKGTRILTLLSSA